jgi:hypothetical protein
MGDEPSFKVVVWNTRGLNDPARRTAVRVAVGDAGASVVCVSESKLQSVTSFDIVECFGPRFDGFVYLPALGTAGGVIIAWCTDDVNVLASREDRFSLSIQLSHANGHPGTEWWLTAVYGPTADDLKPVFLDELRAIRAAITGPWAIAGDFDLILDARDKSNARLNRRSMDMFRRCINDLELRESTLLGRRYTWSSEREMPTLAKLDRWFGSVEWDDLYPEASLTAMSSSLSDHCPILMSSASSLPLKRRFRFESFWTKLDGFLEEVDALWGKDAVSLNPFINIDRKLRNLSRGLQRWSQRKVGSIRDLMLMANELIARLEVAQESRPLSSDECGLRRGLKLRVLGLASLERTIARQRARVAGLRAGDANAQYYRVLASKRRRRDHVASLRMGTRVASDQAAKEELATEFYVGLLGTPRAREFDLDLGAVGLQPVDLAGLEA